MNEKLKDIDDNTYVKLKSAEEAELITSFFKKLGYSRGTKTMYSPSEMFENGYDLVWVAILNKTGVMQFFKSRFEKDFVDDEIVFESVEKFLDRFGLSLEDLKDEDVNKLLEVIL